MSVKEIIETKVAKKMEAKKGTLSGVLVLDISGSDGGQWTVNLDEGLVEAKDSESPNVRIKMTDENFLGLMDGTLNPMTAMFTGKLKIEGDMALATKLASALR